MKEFVVFPFLQPASTRQLEFVSLPHWLHFSALPVATCFKCQTLRFFIRSSSVIPGKIHWLYIMHWKKFSKSQITQIVPKHQTLFLLKNCCHVLHWKQRKLPSIPLFVDSGHLWLPGAAGGAACPHLGNTDWFSGWVDQSLKESSKRFVFDSLI